MRKSLIFCRNPWMGPFLYIFWISGIEMKRKNPDTGRLFRRGDVRRDGYIFFAYTNKRKSDGHFVEIWLRPEASHRATVNDRKRKQQKANGDRGRYTPAHA